MEYCGMHDGGAYPTAHVKPRLTNRSNRMPKMFIFINIPA
jgi:hypothetical protein